MTEKYLLHYIYRQNTGKTNANYWMHEIIMPWMDNGTEWILTYYVITRCHNSVHSFFPYIIWRNSLFHSTHSFINPVIKSRHSIMSSYIYYIVEQKKSLHSWLSLQYHSFYSRTKTLWWVYTNLSVAIYVFIYYIC